MSITITNRDLWWMLAWYAISWPCTMYCVAILADRAAKALIRFIERDLSKNALTSEEISEALSAAREMIRQPIGEKSIAEPYRWGSLNEPEPPLIANTPRRSWEPPQEETRLGKRISAGLPPGNKP